MAKTKSPMKMKKSLLTRLKQKRQMAATMPTTMAKVKAPQESPISTSTYRGLMGFSLVLSVLLQTFLLNYIFRLESTGCACAKDWRRTYIQFYLIVTVVVAVIQLGVLSFDGLQAWSKFSAAISGVMLVFGIIFVVTTLQYVHELKKIKCACSQNVARDVLQIVAIIQAAAYSITALLLIFVVIAAFVAISRA